MLKNNGFHNRHSPFSRPFSPASFFANGEQGWWYDPSNFATLFQDSAGTTPVTAVEQPVGLQLDLSGRGNHRFQSTSANRPVVSARVNLLTKTEQFDDAVWTKANVTASGTRITANAGTFAAYVVANSSSTPATSMTFSAIFPPTSGRYRYVWLGDRGVTPIASATFDLQAVLVIGSDPSVTATASTLPDGSVLCSVVYTKAAAGISGLNIALAGPSYTSDRPSLTWAGGEFVDAKASFVMTNQGVGLPAYQRVNTSTDYDSTGFPTYIKPNGSNQFMVTNSINFTATDKMTVWQGVRKLSDASAGMLVELSSNVVSNNGAFYITAPESGATYGIRTKGTADVTGYNHATFAAPITSVISTSLNNAGAGGTPANCVASRFNGVLNTTGPALTTTGTGNYGNYAAYFYSRAGTSIFFNGNDYGSIARGAASTAAQITAGETYINSKTKAYT